MKAPSLNTGSVNRLVVAIGTVMPVDVERAAEIADDAVALGGRGVDGDQVVVVEVDAVGAELGEPVHARDGIERRPDAFAERIAAAVADRPESEGEFVLRRWSQCHGRVRTDRELRPRDAVDGGSRHLVL